MIVRKIYMGVNLYEAMQQPRDEPYDEKEVAIVDMCSINHIHQYFLEDLM